MVDPLRSAIETTLAGDLDGIKFQKCASELLGELYASLVLISGGHDFGRDGVISNADGQSFNLVCTTSDRVLDNLKRSLDSFVESGGKLGSVIVATSTKITPVRRRHLEEEAKKRGFTLVQVYDHSWFSRELYRNDSWRRELLAISGRPSALSSFPKTRRPHMEGLLIGRDEERSRLRKARGDLVVYGEPGIGKTFLLQSLVEEGWGLFLVDSDVEAIADAIRSQRPDRIIIDDAHFSPGLVENLKHLRISIGAPFDIVLTSWPDWNPDVSASLAGATQVTLTRLTRSQILEVIERCGIVWSRELQSHLVDQARGRAGVAATLSLACFAGGIEAVWRGELLLKDVFGSLGVNRNKDTQALLAIMALAGDSGLDIADAARCLRTSIPSVLESVREAASEGVLEARDSSRSDALVVQPESLRFAIVVEYYFKPKARLPLAPAIKSLPQPSQAAIPLLAAAHRGHSVDRDLVLQLLRGQPTQQGVIGYASLGDRETAVALREFPGMRSEIAKGSLAVAPSRALRTLLESSVGDALPQSGYANNAMQIIAEYAHSLSNSMNNRREVVSAVYAWHKDGGDADVMVNAFALVFDPEIRGGWTSPGSDDQWTLAQGVVSLSDLVELEALWDQALELVATSEFTSLQPILAAWENWVWPSRLMMGTAALPDETYKFARKAARRVAAKIAETFSARPGVIARLKQTLMRANIRGRLDLPDDFEIIFPSRDQPKGEFSIEKHNNMERRQQLKARELGKRLSAENPRAVIERILYIEQEADVAGLNRYPHTTQIVCEEIAARTSHPSSWLLALNSKPNLKFSWYFRPFCDALLTRQEPGWEKLAQGLLASEGLNKIMALSCLKTDVPDDLLEAAVLCCDVSLANVLPHETRFFTRKAKLLLLKHESAVIAGAVAQGQAMEGIGELSTEESDALFAAVVDMPSDDWWIPTLLGQHAIALKQWILNWPKRNAEGVSTYEHISREMSRKIGELSLDDRCEVLNSFPGGISSLASGDIISPLVGEDVETTAIVFARQELKEHRGSTIGDQMDEAWVARAEVALANDSKLEEIMLWAVYPPNRITMWSGDESARWAMYVQKCHALVSGPTQTHRLLGTHGLRLFEAREKKTRQEEHDRAVYGDDP